MVAPRLTRPDKDHLLLEAVGYAARLPLGRFRYYQNALIRRALRLTILALMDDPLVGADVRAAAADPHGWYRAAVAVRQQRRPRRA